MSTKDKLNKSDVVSFAPLLAESVHLLILGTMPGRKSLALQQYYAHPRNALWPILCAMALDQEPSYAVHQQLSYEQRCQLAGDAGIGLWDVLARCERPGSLDGSIVRGTEMPNDIHWLLGEHPELQTIACNGRTAHALFKKHIQPVLVDPLPRIVCLPSTSPAMASLSLQEKYRQWSEGIGKSPVTSNQ